MGVQCMVYMKIVMSFASFSFEIMKNLTIKLSVKLILGSKLRLFKGYWKRTHMLFLYYFDPVSSISFKITHYIF